MASLIFSVHNRPGAYALLVGSGLSTGAGVPTGWRIVRELARELAALEGADAGEDALSWYESHFGEPVTYSAIVERVAPSPSERHAVIGRFLVGADGSPLEPSAAHKAVAALVAGGWVRVVLTTNFDPLLDQALAEAKTDITVLGSPDAITGALPLVHAGPVLVKLHGDHRDPRILNTEEELDVYPSAVNSFLDRVFDDYGLVVCGWSAEHDVALRSAIERTPSRRFTSFWAVRGELAPPAAALVQQRDAVVVPIQDADSFFSELLDGVRALDDARRPDPLSVPIAVGTVKRELSGQAVAVSVHDMIRRELERVRSLDVLAPDPSQSPLRATDDVIAEVEVLTALIATAAYWGRPETDRWYLNDISRLLAPSQRSGSLADLDRPRIPGLIVTWAAGIASVAADRADLQHALFTLPEVPDRSSGQSLPAVLAAAPTLLHVGGAVGRLYRLLRPIFVDHLALGRDAYIEAWERWQYTLAVFAWKVRNQRNVFVPFEWELRADGFRPVVPAPHPWFVAAAQRQGSDHPLVSAQHFGAPDDLVVAAGELVAAFAQEAQRRDWEVLPGGGLTSGALPTGLHYPGSFEEDPDRHYGAV